MSLRAMFDLWKNMEVRCPRQWKDARGLVGVMWLSLKRYGQLARGPLGIVDDRGVAVRLAAVLPTLMKQ